MRRSLEWLYPGLGIKRWLLLAFAGAALLVVSAIVAVGAFWSPQLMRGLGMGWLRGQNWAAAALAGDGLLLGAVLLYLGSRRAWLFQTTTPETAAEIRAAGRLARGPRVTAVGGGNGLAALLRGLKTHTSNLTAVVTMADDGGSSGLLRRDMGMPPPGDLRNCLVALADDESLMSQLFQYRFPDDGGLQGHSFGNLFMAALAQVTGDFERAVGESTRVLKVRGRVLPSTLDDVVLHAQLEGGRQVSGESTITAAARLPRRVWLTPQAPRALPQVVNALVRTDLVVLGPGSLYTSIIPNLLIPEVRQAIRETRGLVVYVCNVMTQPGETDGYTAADHLEALYRHGLAGLVDAVLVNDTPVSADLAASYQRFGALPVVVDEPRLRAMGAKLVHAAVATESNVVRHDSARLAQALLRLVK
ncbi:MAG: gluconeogenesis factor YvcK family protein [Thermoleophilia bacterium]